MDALAAESMMMGDKERGGHKRRTRGNAPDPRSGRVLELCPVPIKTTLVIMPATLITQVKCVRNVPHGG